MGPWEGPRPEGPQWDPQLLAEGDRRNVVDRYRYWRLEAIVDDLDRRRHPFHVAIENWEHDFNIGAVVRNANAFGAAAVHLVGQRRWNRRGAMMTEVYQHVVHHPTVADLDAKPVGVPEQAREGIDVAGLERAAAALHGRGARDGVAGAEDAVHTGVDLVARALKFFQ